MPGDSTQNPGPSAYKPETVGDFHKVLHLSDIRTDRYELFFSRGLGLLRKFF